MKKWRHKQTGQVVSLPDNQTMISTWKLLEDSEETSGNVQKFKNYKDLRANADRSAPAFIGEQEYRFGEKVWEKFND